VVTSRLHGAIIAYGLGLPYVALAGDEKLREFHRLFGGGQLVNSAAELKVMLSQPDFAFAAPGVEPPKPDLSALIEFGNLASGLLRQKQTT
jgi:polysaccharide pyruvyl transferase WcaK-like protein